MITNRLHMITRNAVRVMYNIILRNPVSSYLFKLKWLTFYQLSSYHRAREKLFSLALW